MEVETNTDEGWWLLMLRRIITATVAGLVAALAALVVPAPAQAALNYCNLSYLADMWVGQAEGAHVTFRLPHYANSYYMTGSCQIRANGSSPRDGVMSIQRSLRYCHGQSIAIDGAYGDRTAAAMRTVQSRLGLTADGRWGPATAKAMSWSTNLPDRPGCLRLTFDNNMYFTGYR